MPFDPGMRTYDDFDPDDDNASNTFDLAAEPDDAEDEDAYDDDDFADRCAPPPIGEMRTESMASAAAVAAAANATELPTDPELIEDLSLLNVDLLRRLVDDCLTRRGERGVN